MYSTKGVAKILRGRSIFVQVLSRNFASKFIDNLGLTECNLIMLAGGKFYIIAPDTSEFENKFKEINNDIEKFLWDNFNADISFNSAFIEFNYEYLRDKKITFGNIVEDANKELLENRKRLFSNELFNSNEFNQNSFVINKKYIDPKENDSNSIKCRLTNKPIVEDQIGSLDTIDGPITNQIQKEFEIGHKITNDNIIVEINNDGLRVNDIFPLEEYKGAIESQKILINPDLGKILKIIKKKKTGKLDFLKNSRIIEVASYVRENTDEDKEKFPDDVKNKVMTFGRLAEQGEGVNYLTMIKGDIDNLGLIMALGLDRDKNSLSSISRITTMSNHLKYFFSFFLNELLEKKHPNTYTIFAGGDDLMLLTPQSEAVNLVDSFNENFNSFICGNEEIHVSYSITHFKDHTPIKLVNKFANENQELVKKGEKMEVKENCFNSEFNKSATFIFNTKIKNSELIKLKINIDKLSNWKEENDSDKNKGISMGVLRNLMQLTEIMKNYRETKDTSKLIWHPMLTYMINRNLKKNDVYKDIVVGEFFEKVLKLSKNDKELEFEKILYPAICGAIYKLRKTKN